MTPKEHATSEVAGLYVGARIADDLCAAGWEQGALLGLMAVACWYGSRMFRW